MDTKIKCKNLILIKRLSNGYRFYLADNGYTLRFDGQNITGWWMPERGHK